MSTTTAAQVSTRRRTTRALTVVVAAVAAFAVWLVAGPVAGVDFTVTRDGKATEVGAAQVLGIAAAAGLLGWGLLALLERFTDRAGRIWTVVAVVVLLASFVMPFNSGAIDTAAKWVLLSLHLTVGAVLIPSLGRAARAGRRDG